MKDFTTVFQAYPEAQEIFVVGDMPFLDRSGAANYAAPGQEIKVVQRSLPLQGAGEGDDLEPTAPTLTIDAVAAEEKRRKRKGQSKG